MHFGPLDVRLQGLPQTVQAVGTERLESQSLKGIRYLTY